MWDRLGNIKEDRLATSTAMLKVREAESTTTMEAITKPHHHPNQKDTKQGMFTMKRDRCPLTTQMEVPLEVPA